MDIVTLGAALNGSKAYTDQVTQSLMGGVHYRGSVSYYSDLPNDVTEGDSYTVKYAGTSGSVADGTEYTWGYDTDLDDYAWISFSKDAYSKAETDTLLAAKQDELSAAQLAAVNSGITAADVAQIGTNTTDIATVADNITAANTLIENRTGYGSMIAESTDLNTITVLGTYYIQTGTVAATLTNIPSDATSGGGRLIVLPLNANSSSRVTQVLIPNWNPTAVRGAYYVRQLYASNTWSSWYKFSGTEVV